MEAVVYFNFKMQTNQEPTIKRPDKPLGYAELSPEAANQKAATIFPFRIKKAALTVGELREVPNVFGVGFGVKETGGRLTPDLAIRIYVRAKVPDRELSRPDRIPSFIGGVPTDVIPIGKPIFHARPVALGASISHIDGSGGSLGCIVSRPGDDSWFILSASHVLVPSGHATAGDQIVEPAAEDGAGEPIATLADFESLRPDGEPNFFDAALARVIRKADVRPQLPIIGRVDSQVMDPVLYQSVRKYGAGTLHTIGVVTDVTAQTDFAFNGNDYSFQNVIQVTGCGDGDFSVGGDSGALVVDALTNRPVGLIIGGAGTRTFVSPLRPILSRFGVKLVT